MNRYTLSSFITISTVIWKYRANELVEREWEDLKVTTEDDRSKQRTPGNQESEMETQCAS